MGNWIISPSQDVINNNDGSFTLPCSNTDVVYRITYVEGSCSSNTVTYTYVTSGNCGTCTDFMGNLSIIGDTLPATSASSQLLGYATKTTDYTSYTFESSNKSMIDNIKLGTTIAPDVYVITGTVYENTSSYGRSSTISVIAKGPNTPSSGCPGSFTVGQDAGGGGGSCPVSGDIITKQVVDAAGSQSTPIMRVLKNSTYTGYSFSSSDTSKINPSGVLTPTVNDWYLVMANVAANTGDLRRTIPVTVNMSGTSTPSSGCEYTVDVEQKGSCSSVDDLYYVGPMHNYQLAGNSQTDASVAYVAYYAPYSSWTVAFSAGTGSYVRNATVTNQPGGPGGTKKVTVDIDENNTGAERKFGLILTGTKTDGDTCSKSVVITQAVKTTTCTCADLVINGIEEQSPSDFNYTCYIQNNTNSAVTIAGYYFDVAAGDEEKFHNVQTVPANTTLLFANTYLDDDYEGLTSVNVANAIVYVGSSETPVNVSTDSNMLYRGGSITLIYNG